MWYAKKYIASRKLKKYHSSRLRREWYFFNFLRAIYFLHMTRNFFLFLYRTARWFLVQNWRFQCINCGVYWINYTIRDDIFFCLFDGEFTSEKLQFNLSYFRVSDVFNTKIGFVFDINVFLFIKDISAEAGCCWMLKWRYIFFFSTFFRSISR